VKILPATEDVANGISNGTNRVAYCIHRSANSISGSISQASKEATHVSITQALNGTAEIVAGFPNTIEDAPDCRPNTIDDIREGLNDVLQHRDALYKTVEPVCRGLQKTSQSRTDGLDTPTHNLRKGVQDTADALGAKDPVEPFADVNQPCIDTLGILRCRLGGCGSC